MKLSIRTRWSLFWYKFWIWVAYQSLPNNVRVTVKCDECGNDVETMRKRLVEWKTYKSKVDM